jgi:hypothetical protein
MSYHSAYRRLTSPSLGVDVDKVTSFQLAVRPGTSPAGIASELQQIVSRVSTVPDVERVSFSSDNPVLDAGYTTSITVEGVGRFLNGEPTHVTPGRHVVGPQFVRTIGARLIAGREFTWAEPAGVRPVLVNEAAVAAYWQGENPIGRRLKFGRIRDGEPWATVVGVVSNVRHEGYRGLVKPEVYLSYTSEVGDVPSIDLLVRENQGRARGAVERLLATGGGSLELATAGTLSDAAGRSVAELRRSNDTLMNLSGLALSGYVAALLLAFFTEVRRRERELATCLALGAETSHVLLGQFRRSFLPPLVTSILGLAVGVLALQLLQRIDYDIRALSAWQVAFAGAVVPIVVAAAILATVPAFRRLDVAGLLRST